MANTHDECAFDLDVVRLAAKNWKHCQKERERKRTAIDDRRYSDAESPERLAKRVNHLADKIRQAVPIGREHLPETLKTIAATAEFRKDDIDDVLFERVIGETRDFLSVEFLELGVQAIRSVGRVVTRLNDGRVSFGTGFMVSPRILITNNHVLRDPAEAMRSRIEFNYQRDMFGRSLSVQPFDLDPAAFFFTDIPLDFTLVAVNPRPLRDLQLDEFGSLPLIGTEGKISIGEPINIIQHPRGEMKQLVVRENRLLDLPPDLDTVAHYTADTEPGSSGSPVFSDAWEVVALHHSGVPKTNSRGDILDIDGKVWKRGDDPTRIAWVANEGIRISRIVNAIRNAPLEPAAARMRDTMLDPERAQRSPRPQRSMRQPQPPRDSIPDHPVSGPGHALAEGPDGAISVQIPLTLTLRLGGGEVEIAGGVLAPPTTRTQDFVEVVKPDPDYSSRPGYDPDFLGFPVPLPDLGDALADKAAPLSGSDETELKYYHYSVVMNRERRLAFFAAGNFDAAAQFSHPRKDRDKWYLDPRVDDEIQADNRFYKHNPLDRGHLFRRAAGGWGTTPAIAKQANDDTFHWTNCSPQHEVFNQSKLATSRNLRLWGNLENHIARTAFEDDLRLAIFCGPVFRENDPVHRGLQVPREFWKVIVFPDETQQPKAVGFVISQQDLIRDLAPEAFGVGEFAVYQVRVKDIEKKTGLRFGEVIDFDPLESDVDASVAESAVAARPLVALDEIVL